MAIRSAALFLAASTLTVAHIGLHADRNPRREDRRTAMGTDRPEAAVGLGVRESGNQIRQGMAGGVVLSEGSVEHVEQRRLARRLDGGK